MSLRRQGMTGPIVAAVTILFVASRAASAFDPAVEQAGPLRVRIAGPEVTTATETAQAVSVVVENQSDQAIAGMLQMHVVDRWRCEPADAVPFTAPTRGEATYEFRVAAGEGTYSAHYPIHVEATFTWKGQVYVAHPILILETKLPDPPQPTAEVEWKVVKLTPDRAWSVWRIPVLRAVIAVFEQAPQTMPVGWMGSAAGNRASLRLDTGLRLAGAARDSIAIHPPWAKGQVGTAWVEFPLALPDAKPIRLQFANAVTPTGDGDGVTFRVRVLPLDAPTGQPGEAVFERHSAAKTWEVGEADLSRFAGQSIRLQLESHPGPAKNTAFDQAYWGEPTLVIGEPPRPAAFPPPGLDGSVSLGTMRVGSGAYEVRMWPGRRGLLDTAFGFLGGAKKLYFRGFRVRVLGMRLDDPGSPVTLVETKFTPVDGGYEVLHRCEMPQGAFELLGRVQIQDNALHVAFRLENAPAPHPWFAPHIEELAVEQFDQTAERVYAGHGNVIERPGPFDLTFDGHRLATSHVGFDFAGGLSLVQAVDLPPERLAVEPDARHFSLHVPHNATFTLVPASSVWEAAKHYRDINGLKPAPGISRLAGRFVLDLWGGRYDESSDSLQRAFRYGLTDAAVVWHNWQRWGYDYRLPEIYPPNPKLGTEEELRRMIDDCRQAGVLLALHDNYIDLYPDAAGFSYDKEIAFSAGGEPVRAWYNEGRAAQSYRYRADRIEHFLLPNVRTIHDKLAPTAYFVDVWSSVRPYDYWTADGRFVDSTFTRDTWGRQFARIRELLGENAPQISESGHDQLIGSLDGAQSNHLRVGTPLPGDRGSMVWNIACQDAERVPWFDFAHHDRFALHGAGYPGRYEAGLDPRTHGIYSDDYLATEVLTGHPAMVSQPFGRDVVRKYWLTHDLMRALALRSMESVEFADGDLHRQQVQWSDGGMVWVNRGATDWQTAGCTLPEYGFVARVPTAEGLVTATVVRRQGIITETASSAQAYYVNGRQPHREGPRIRPSLVSLEADGPRTIKFLIRWQAEDPVPDGYRPFFHFVDSHGEIVFQGAYDPKEFQVLKTGAIPLPATASWPEGGLPGEQFELRVGLYAPRASGSRLPLLGPDDGERRLPLGTVELVGAGTQVTGVRWKPAVPAADPYLARQNVDCQLIDFGLVRTADGCRLVPGENSLLLIPLPSSGAARARYELCWERLPWELPKPTHIEALAEDGRIVRRTRAPRMLTIDAEPDVFAWRLTAD